MAFWKQHSSSQLKSSRTTKIQYLRQILPPDAITDFVWKDYSSDLFRSIQELRQVKYEDYISSICCHETLTKLVTLGGSDRPLFYFSHDERFIIKTVHKSQARVLMDLLPSYYEHIKKYESSLLEKYYGLHAVRPASGAPKVYFVVLKNLLQTERRLHQKYDLKGTSNRRSSTQIELDPSAALSKDADFHFRFFLDPPTQTDLLEQIKLDCQFLEEHGLMNYSLLLGMHVASQEPENGKASSFVKATGSHLSRDPSFSYLVHGPTSRFGADLGARAIRTPCNETGSTSRGQNSRREEASMQVYLYMGIVDLLHNYNVTKRIEYAYKSLQYDPKEIPCVKPPLYASRFQDFLSNVFLPEEN